MNAHSQVVPPRVTTVALRLQLASVVLGLFAFALAALAWLIWKDPRVAISLAPAGPASIVIGVAAVVSGFASIYAWQKAVALGLPPSGPIVWWRG
jgi:hypothetical protein